MEEGKDSIERTKSGYSRFVGTHSTRTGRRRSVTSNLFQDTNDAWQVLLSLLMPKEFADKSTAGRVAYWMQSTRFEGLIAVALLTNVLWMAVSLQVNGARHGLSRFELKLMGVCVAPFPPERW